MNILNLMGKATTEFVLVSILTMPFVSDPLLLVWYSMAILLAFVLRLGIEYNNNALTWKSGIIQGIYTISYCYLAVMVWFSWLNYSKGFEVYLFLNSLFAVFMVGQLQSAFKIGVRAYAKKWLQSILAKEDKEAGNGVV